MSLSKRYFWCANIMCFLGIIFVVPGSWRSYDVGFQVLERSLLLLPQFCFRILHVAVDAALVLVQLLRSLNTVELLGGFDVGALKVVSVNLKN
jgi:hypothetical protein